MKHPATVRALLTALEQRSPVVRRELRRLYGADPALLEERRQAYVKTLTEFARVFGAESEVVLARAPGRINLLGRHIDHRGGYCNTLALNLEVLLVAQRRDDDRFVLHNCEPEYQPREFCLRDELPPTPVPELADWDQWTLQQLKVREERGLAGHWTGYVQASAVSFQEHFRASCGELAPPLRGMNAMVYGTLPRSAGLSSSSALFVASAEALLALNGLSLEAAEFVELCGRGEWYVGTRGGSGDHAALKFGRVGHVSHVGFFPTTLEHAPFSPVHRVVIADSGEHAQKGAGARDAFNQRVTAYELGLPLIREQAPELHSRLEHLRDLNPENTGLDEPAILALLAALPQRLTREQARQTLPRKCHPRLEELFAAHAEPPDGYRVRDVCLFGVAECLRSRDCFELLKEGELTAFGNLMNRSHDGDRVTRLDGEGRRRAWTGELTDAQWQGLLNRSRRGDPEASLRLQPGGYACSTPRIDELVDLSLASPGVLGAQLSGAGLGGCMMALVEADRAEALVERLNRNFYEPRQLPAAAHLCTPVEGAGIVSLP